MKMFIEPGPPKFTNVLNTRKGNGRYTSVCDLACHVESINATVQASIVAQIDRDKNTNEERITISAWSPKGLTFKDDATAVAYRVYALKAAKTWLGYRAAAESAVKRLTQPTVKVARQDRDEFSLSDFAEAQERKPVIVTNDGETLTDEQLESLTAPEATE